MNKYLDHDYSTVFTNAEIHWHLWNEVIELIKERKPGCHVHIIAMKRLVYNMMVKCKVVNSDDPTKVSSLSNWLCVLCCMNPSCVNCPLDDCRYTYSYYYMANQALDMANECYVIGEGKETFDRYIKIFIENATKIRDILEPTTYIREGLL